MSDNFISALFVFPFFLVFCRIGGAFAIFPVFTDPAVPMRVRVLIAVTISFVMYPMLYTNLPDMPRQVSVMIMLVITELLIGIMMAIGARLFMSTMNVAGDVLSFMSGFQAAMLFDPRSSASSTAPAAFLVMVATVLILAIDLHHYMINALFESYELLPVGQLPYMGDVAAAITNTVADMFLIGVKLAAPVVAAGFLTYAGFGILNRMVPQVQAFFIALPLNILLGLFMLGVSLGGMLTLFTDEIMAHAIIFAQEG